MNNHNIQPLLNKKYLKAITAKGIYITDENGKSYIDGSSGAITCSLGHSHPRVLGLMKQQLDKLQFVYRSQFGSNEAELLADKLFQLSPNQKYSKTFFVNSGSEAIETAIKIALQYWRENGQPKKNQFITRKKSYHGITMGALSISGHQIRRAQFESSLIKNPRLLTSDLENDPLEKHLYEIEQIIEEAGIDTLAGLVLEPIIGAAGTALVPPDGYYEQIRSLCDRHNILMIADEVMTGLGRTGKWFALDHWGTYADIVTIGKSLGAGYAPIAATLITNKIYNPIEKGSGIIISGHTYSGHPLSCATALCVLNTIEEDNLIENVYEKGEILKTSLLEIKSKYNFITKVRGKGLLLGVEFVPSIKNLQAQVIEGCFKNGLLVYPSVGGEKGEDENGIMIAPPFVINNNEMELLIAKLNESLSQLKL